VRAFSNVILGGPDESGRRRDLGDEYEIATPYCVATRKEAFSRRCQADKASRSNLRDCRASLRMTKDQILRTIRNQGLRMISECY
jgi:hypothetical protein